MDSELPMDRFTRAWQSEDARALRAVLREYPETLNSKPNKSEYMIDAGRSGNPEILAALVDFGMDINTKSEFGGKRAIEAAARSDRADAVRWLVEHGAEVNSRGKDGKTRCYALYSAIRENFDLVKFLVEAGADVNTTNEKGTTPLSFALYFDKHEIADYLRSKGALKSQELPGYEPVVKDPIVKYVEERIGEAHPLAWLPIIPDDIPVAVHTVFNLDHYCLFTVGMSSWAMNAPPGNERFRHAELVLYLDEWDTDIEAWQAAECVWVIQWLRRLAQYPCENDTWLGGKVAVIANGDPPRPLSEFTEMTCWLLLYEKPPLERVELPDGRSVVFYTVVPLHTAERDYERDHGTAALLKKFAEQDVSVKLVAGRPSVV